MVELHAETLSQPDTHIWSFDSTTNQIYFGNYSIDSLVVTDSAMNYFRTNPVYRRRKENNYGLPDTIFIGMVPVATKLLIEKRMSAQGSMNRWLNDNKSNLLVSMCFIKPPFMTPLVMQLEKSVSELQGGTEMRVDAGEKSPFTEWSLNGRFLLAKRDIEQLKRADDTLHDFLKNCPDTAGTFYSYKKLFQLVVLLDGSIAHAAQYCTALESADKKKRDEVATINSWINDVLQGEVLAIESFCYQNVPAVKTHCYEDLINYVMNAEKRGLVLMSMDDIVKIRLRR
jgi:hypothetical protein